MSERKYAVLTILRALCLLVLTGCLSVILLIFLIAGALLISPSTHNEKAKLCVEVFNKEG